MGRKVDNEEPAQFHFWRILIFCLGLVVFCGVSAWVVTSYFY